MYLCAGSPLVLFLSIPLHGWRCGARIPHRQEAAANGAPPAFALINKSIRLSTKTPTAWPVRAAYRTKNSTGRSCQRLLAM